MADEQQCHEELEVLMLVDARLRHGCFFCPQIALIPQIGSPSASFILNREEWKSAKGGTYNVLNGTQSSLQINL